MSRPDLPKGNKLRESELQLCAQCGKSPLENIFFYQVKIEQMLVDQRAVQRQAGLIMQLGNAALASVMGPNEAIAQGVGEKKILLCGDCGTGINGPFPLALLLEDDESDE